ncbi:PilT/PilU family type 4a pilus ATPase [Campylobacter gracilis]|uniref:Twitching motility protein n=3 Tax=Campylobacter TaxID=194 RepID=C8PEQ6_9BACT|nr:PilT/PilU family type 4a pilus ATPase [Campylobacter gracilis]EEV18534.1 twitching motility protein [Campylobacter gracilis RM3268]RKV98123.1 MAG: PilT/PilU family type 4a pilus ATPase [Campylobacter sp.]UEB45904.1 PilT/PilU family type 4a pilus ATPase [Campylobacter gracilis]SUW77658.1 twitching mobility protein [Campylobacter gracilis]
MAGSIDYSQYQVDASTLDFKQRDRLNKYLEFLIQNGGSDLHIKSGAVIRGRIHGELVKFSKTPFLKEDAMTLAKELLITRFPELIEKKSVDFTYKLNEDYRFRVNIFFQIDGISAVFRTIPVKIPEIDDLGLPPSIKDICDTAMRGVVLLTGPTGSGKTTTIASMINRINRQRTSHVVTIEDPVEFVFKDDKCIINQRAIGEDCNNFADSLRAALREDPDVIFVGEMRDLETIETALHAAETGHLVFSTVHTIDAKETVNRIIAMFEQAEQERIRMTLASVLEAVISQRLARTIEGKRVAVVEILRKNTRIKDMILDARDDEIPDAIADGRNTYGMQTFDQHLLDLYRDGVITREEALDKASKRNDLDLQIKNVDLAKKRDLAAESGESAEEMLAGEVVQLKEIR